MTRTVERVHRELIFVVGTQTRCMNCGNDMGYFPSLFIFQGIQAESSDAKLSDCRLVAQG